MKILFIIDNLGSGGAQNQLTLLAAGLQERGHHTTVFTYYPQDFFKQRLINAGSHLVYKPKTTNFGLEVVLELRKLIQKENFDALISFMDTPNFYLILAKHFSKKYINTLISYRSKTDFTKLSFFSKSLREWVNKKATHIMCNSHHERERWVARYPYLHEKTETVYNGVNQTRFRPKKVGTTHRVFNKLLYVGSVSSDKNGVCVIEALKILKENNCLNFKLKWVGQIVLNLPDRKAYYDKMIALIQEYHLEDYWEWGKPTQKIEEEYYTHDALLLASTTEGLPNVVCEALSCGLPVIISNHLDHPRIVTNKKTGYLFDPNRPEELANMIQQFYNLSPKVHIEMKNNASESAKKMFSTQLLLESVLQIIHFV